MAVPGLIERVFRKRKDIWLEMNNETLGLVYSTVRVT
jgi:hypothetical protein